MNDIVALTGATLFDGTGALPRAGSTVVTNGSTIIEVSDRRDFGSEVSVIDVGGRTLMPGVIDGHVHLAPWAQWLAALPRERPSYLMSKTVHAMRATVEHGITTVRDLGGLDSGFVRAVREGILPGPSIQTAVVIISPTNGVPDLLGATSVDGRSIALPGMPLPHADGPDAGRRKVREVMRAGADVIKIAASAVSLRGSVALQEPSFSRAELDAIVDESHTHGLQVTCHANGGRGALWAVQAGVDTIEHGNSIDDETIGEMAERGTWLLPLLWIVRYQSHGALSDEEADQRMAAYYATLRKAMRAGVRVALGSDSGQHGLFGTYVEMQLMVRAGLSPVEVLACATRRAAECLQIDKEVGTIEVGKQADLLVVDGDPLQDVSVLADFQRLALVMKAGVAISGAIATHLPRSENGRAPAYEIKQAA